MTLNKFVGVCGIGGPIFGFFGFSTGGNRQQM
jgi:hypothetical protein